MMKRSIILLSFSLLVLGVAGIAFLAESRAEVAAVKTTKLTVVCEFYVRPSTRVAKFDKKQIRVEIPVTDGPVPEIARAIPPKTADFDDFRVQVNHNTNSLTVRISDRKTDRPITSHLFQLGPKLHNQFHGGHGFTGLGYVYHPKSEAELQFWCKVK